jgi:hypothetical protein
MAPKFNPVLSIEDARKKLMSAVSASYPQLDALMVETAVDVFMAHPNATPDEIIASVPAGYFHSAEWRASHPEPIAEEAEEQDQDQAQEDGSAPGLHRSTKFRKDPGDTIVTSPSLSEAELSAVLSVPSID